MPPKRKTAEIETPSNKSDNAALDRPEGPTLVAQPAPAKRQRVSRACDQCRAAREKCDGIQPECFPCVSQRRPCTYEVNPRKRGVQTGYIRTLELALGWVFEKVPGSEDTLSALLAHEGGQGQTILAGKDPRGADRLHKRWRRSRVHQGIECILSGGSVPSPDQDGRSLSGDASDAEGDEAAGRSSPPLVEAGADITTQESPNPRSASIGHAPPPGGLSDVERQREISQPISRSSPPSSGRLKLPPNHWRLLDIYFSYTHSWLPILEKQEIFQASYLYPEEGLVVDPVEASCGVHAELWAALALASLQDAASLKLSSSNDADPIGPCPTEVYGIARGLLPSENGPFQVHHARALLLLSLVNLGRDKLTGAWLLAGSAIRILLDANTAQSCRQDRERQRMTLALMSCFMADTILSARCNKPPHLRAEDISDLPPVPEDGLDQWEPWAPCDGFGDCHGGSRSSRSPAFCMSTFNQLYAILRVVASEMSARRRGSSPRERVEAFNSQLQGAINLNSPFGSFITSPICGSASVPTAYIARTTYLWASALADPLCDGFLPLLSDTLGQYQKLFGRCAMPPFITSCIASITSQEHLLGRGEQQKERLRSLVTVSSPRWDETRRPSRVPSSHPNPLLQPLGMASATQFSTQGNSTMAYPTPLMPSLYSNPTPTQHTQPHHINRGYGSFEAPGLATPYQRPFTNPSTALPQETAISMSMHMGSGMASTSHNRAHHLLPPAGFGATPDYEALLDDLASIECTDTVDVDPQFMANLGFAPGCDIAEIFTRDFGGA